MGVDLNKTRKIYRPFRREPKIDTSTTTVTETTTITSEIATGGMRLQGLIVAYTESDFPAFEYTSATAY